MIQGVRVLNPGALHRAKTHTVLLLETTTAHATWLDVDVELDASLDVNLEPTGS
jgi:hypothetical protein